MAGIIVILQGIVHVGLLAPALCVNIVLDIVLL